MRGDNCTVDIPPDHEIPQMEGYRHISHEPGEGCMRGDNRTEAYPPDHEIPQIEGYLRWRDTIPRSRTSQRVGYPPAGREDVCTTSTAL